MLHDRDEKYENSDDEPEYHFSEEEGGDYLDADSEAPKDESELEPTPAATVEPKQSRGIPSKRMLISLVVFLSLVYVVYKMVAPTAQVPATEIAAQTTQPKPTVAVTATPPEQQAPTSEQTPQVPAVIAVNPPVQTSPPASTPGPAVVNTMVSSETAASATPSMMPAPSVVSGTSQGGQPQPSPIQQATVAQAPMGGVAPPPAVMPQQTIPVASAPPAATGMPSVIPVQSPVSPVNVPANGDVRSAALEAESAKLMTQLQSDYVQKLNDFASQNKALQEQVQTLNSRMMTMETQMGQLIQALTRQTQNGGNNSELQPAMEASPQRSSYNVQAIIPGRAWLRSDNGETLTVAEGDVIKSLGRVTKIDPYDGVVEVNTGNKMVSLSYGNGA